MALTANEIIALACDAAHSPGKVASARLLLNSILSDVCQTWDIAAARGDYVFNFIPGLLQQPPSPIPAAQFGSGPYPLPVDYLRLSGSSGSSGVQRSFIWYLNGVPYAVIPCDLAEFDMQVQQAGLNSYVWLGATDMSSPVNDRIILSTTGVTTAASDTITNIADTTRLTAGLGIAGNGIVPGTMILSVSGNTCVISNPATLSDQQTSLLIGYPPTIWIYPPPSSSQQARIRYQKRMPDIFDFTRYPWFTNDSYLRKKLIGELCLLNDDSRADRILGGPNVVGSADNQLSGWLQAKDDDVSRPKTVTLDRRAFGSQFPYLKSTKSIGW